MANNSRTRRRERDDDHPAIWVGYGKLVKLFRTKNGFTQQELADAVGYSCEQVASIEQERRPAKTAFTEAAERVLGAGEVLAELQEDVDRAKLPKFFQDFASIEAEAVSRFTYDPLVVPGLLQTPEYARALLCCHCPPMDDEIIDQRLEARLERQKRLTRSPAIEISFVIGEGVLRCPVGGADVLRTQLQRLLDRSEMRNVEIQVLPISHGAHAGLHGPMVLLETTSHQQVAYFESHGEGVVITDPNKVSQFGLRYGKLRTQALNGMESARFIERLLGAE
ncbi:helix-turn-helix transcriptional regulator [Streptomyces sp.]|uniref:helix-turn-helix domain-containing protein n=1 Tax=Streptomyces sp. TaxID=1931 RepID=UPI002812287D|nr:helix-turn-helix transcriptional regulator [Streptomyces sp.]